LSILIAIILGIVQGLTEFLPVSSSGHLVLLQRVFNINQHQLLFNIILHIATLIAVVFVFRKTVLTLIKNPFSKKAKMLVVATIITLILAYVFEDFFKSDFDGGMLSFTFLITATFLVVAEYVSKSYKNNKNLTYKSTSIMGLFQAAAIVPGISRSGATITSAIVQGVNKKDAAEFSFLMSIPIILASLMWEVLNLKNTATVSIQVLPTILGFLFATVFGILAIKVMLRVINKAKYFYFSIYLVVLSLVILLNEHIFFWF
jgi:undecaprenyl-diphosphatase